MPIYEFRCQCGFRFEQLCRMDESGESVSCPQCGHIGVKRLMSVFMATGLENGHHGLGKTWGGGGSPAAKDGAADGASDGDKASGKDAAKDSGGAAAGVGSSSAAD